MPTEKARIVAVVDDELMKEIEDLRFAKRYASRSKLMCELLRLGLQSMQEQEVEQTGKPDT